MAFVRVLWTRHAGSMVPPMATCPVPVPPVRSSIISVSVRSVIITGRIVARSIKWHWNRNRKSDENSSFGLRLEKHRHSKSKRKDQKKSSHIVKSLTSRLITRLPSAAFSIARAEGNLNRRPQRGVATTTKEAVLASLKTGVACSQGPRSPLARSVPPCF